MAVDYNIWGAPEDWRDLSDFTFSYLADFKCPKSGANSYGELYDDEVLQGGDVPTDLSISFWGINKNSILAHPVYLASYWDDNEIKTSVNRVTENATTVPCILNYSGDPSIDIRTNWYKRYAPADNPGEAEWDKMYIAYSDPYSREIAISFNYQKIILVPWVKIALENPVDSWGYQVVTLKDYIDNRSTTYANYNKIVGIGYRIAVGSNNRSENNTGIGFVIPTSYEASEREYISDNTYKWFATEYGYYSLYANGILGNSNTRSITPYNDGQSGTAPIDFSSMHMIGDADTGFRYKYCTNYNSDYGQVPIYYYDTDNPLWKVNAYTPWNTDYAHPFPYIECTTANVNDVRDYVLTQIAYLGFPFVYDDSKARDGQIGDTGVFLPVFDDAGVTTGEYEEGAAALALPNSEWIDGRTGSGYDPYAPEPPEGGDMDNVTGRNLNFWSSNKYYLMRQYDLDKFLATVNGLYTGGSTAEEKAEELRKMQVEFKGSNPSDYIVGLYGIPFQWPGGYQAFQPVMLGPVEVLPNDSESDTAVELLNPDFNVELLFGEIEIPELGNFLDYEPYTTLMLYVPFCGTCKLDAAEYIGHTVRVVGTLDKHTGELAVRIIRDGLTVTNTMTGNLYVRVPITAQSMGTYETNLHQLQMAAFNREFGLLTNAVTGGVSMGAAAAAGGEGEGGGSGGMISPTAPISMAASLIQLPIAMADYDFRITHCQPPVFYSSSASSANQAKFYRKAKLFIKRPVFLDTYNTDIGKYVYSHTVGYACCKQVEHINDMATAEHDHLIKCSNVDLTGIPATADELAAIKKALTQGIYI